MSAHFLHIRLLTEADLPAVMAVQAACYEAGFHEPQAAFANKLAEASDSCWGAWQGDALRGYLFCLPADADHLPALHASSWRRPADAAWLYLHDMAVHPDARGLGVAGRLLEAARTRAHAVGVEALVLVAVQGSVPYWTRHGFATVAPSPPIAAKLRTFGDGAHFMQQTLR